MLINLTLRLIAPKISAPFESLIGIDKDIDVIAQDASRVYLWHRKNIMIHNTRLTGYVPVPDGLVRLRGMRLQ